MTSLARRLGVVAVWFDSWAYRPEPGERSQRVDWARVTPFLLLHLMCLGPVLVGWSWTAVGVAVALYWIRAFALTAFYHRCFSHRAFRTSRSTQFLFALLGASAAQRGPLWWAAHHRLHHRNADGPEDVHSPHQHGFWWSHMGWITAPANFPTRLDVVPDLARFPELRLLDRFDMAAPALLAGALFVGGGLLEGAGVNTSGPQLLVWGFFISTVALFHATCLINSLAHQIGPAPLRDPRPQRQQPHAGAADAGRGLAQQPSPLSERGAAGVLLVGDRRDLLPAGRPVVARGRPGPAPGAGAREVRQRLSLPQFIGPVGVPAHSSPRSCCSKFTGDR